MSDAPKLKLKDFPFSSAVWDKTSKEGKDYTSVCIQQTVKQQDGTYKNVDIYMFVADLLKLSNLAERTYQKIMDGQPSKSGDAAPSSAQPVDDDIPF